MRANGRRTRRGPHVTIGIEERADAASGADAISCILGGVVVRYAALSTDTAEPGAKLYFDIGNDRLTVTAGTNNYAGRAAKTKLNGDTTADVYLGMP